MALPPIHLFNEIYQIHGHRCPMSTLGGRLGFAARERLDGQQPLSALYFINTCAADGISVMTGCKKAEGTLMIVERDRHALWLKDSGARGLFTELSDYALQLAGEYRLLDQSFEKEKSSFSPEELQRRQLAKEFFLDDLLQKLWTLPDYELMDFSTFLPSNLYCEND